MGMAGRKFTSSTCREPTTFLRIAGASSPSRPAGIFRKRRGAPWGSSSSTMTTTAEWTCSSRICTRTCGRTHIYDNDGRMDLFVTDMHSDMWADASPEDEKKKAPKPLGEDMLMGPTRNFIFGNALYHNLGAGKFEEVSDRMGVETYWPW